jgi:hypothetical protein
MRDWIRAEHGLQPRPLVFIEDHCGHVFDLCNALAANEAVPGEILERCTIVLLDAPGPDTAYETVRLLLTYPTLQVVAGPFATPLRPCLLDFASAVVSGTVTAAQVLDADIDALLSTQGRTAAKSLAPRYSDLSERTLQDEPAFARLLDQLIRPGGLVVCDIELLTLPFAQGSARALYGGVRAASIACQRQAQPEGHCSQQTAKLLIVSNREKFGTRIDKVLADCGVHVGRDDIFRKSDDLADVAAHIRDTLGQRFPWRLHMKHPRDGGLIVHHTGRQDKALLDSSLDVVTWPAQDGAHLVSGFAVLDARSVVEFSGRAQVLLMLTEAYLKPGSHAVAYDDICARLEALNEKQSPSQVIEGILRMLHPEQQRRVIPKGTNYTYRFGDDARIGLIRE